MVIDLTLTLQDGLKMLGSFPPVAIEDFFSYESTKQRYLPPCEGCKAEKLSMVTHIGTHADAPAHFLPGGRGMSEIAVEKYMGNAIVADVSDRDDQTPVTREQLLRAVKLACAYQAGDILLLRLTKRTWPDPSFCAVKGLSEEAAQFVVESGFKAVGIDAMCVDCLDDMRRPAHLCLLKNEVVIVEGLVNLDKIPQRRCWFSALPLKIEHAGGSPVRAICIV